MTPDQRAAQKANEAARARKWASHAADNGGRCEYCDDSGDVHSIDGEWRGICICPSGDEIRKRIPAKETQ